MTQHRVTFNFTDLCRNDSSFNAQFLKFYHEQWKVTNTHHTMYETAEELCHIVTNYLENYLHDSGRKVLKVSHGNPGSVTYEGKEVSESELNGFLSDAGLDAMREMEENLEWPRDVNPSHSGLSLGSVALGAALGAAAMHFGMRKKAP